MNKTSLAATTSFSEEEELTVLSAIDEEIALRLSKKGINNIKDLRGELGHLKGIMNILEVNGINRKTLENVSKELGDIMVELEGNNHEG